MTDEIRKLIAAATVRLSGDDNEKIAQGVLVPGGFIATAAHCIKWSATGRMTLGEIVVETIVTPSGATFLLGPVAVDAVSDLALLGALDAAEFSDDCEAFEAWCEATKPVAVGEPKLPARRPGKGAKWPSIPIHVYTHRGTWITGKATRYATGAPGSQIALEADGKIEFGTSGGPVVDDAGRLIGIVSQSSGRPDGTCIGLMPLAHLALPRWAWDRIVSGGVS